MANRHTKKKEEIPLILLTNDRKQFKADQLIMFYKAASLAQLAYMDGLDPDTNEIVPLLVGLEPTEGNTQFKVYPLAKLISKHDDIKNYLVPDGNGKYVDYSLPQEEAGQAEESGSSLTSIGDTLG